MRAARTSFLFDLDGTLVDSVYQHVMAWKEALDAEGIPLSVWRIHRKIGMSGGLFARMLLRETGLELDEERSIACAACMPPPMCASRSRCGHCRARSSCCAISTRPASPGRSPPAVAWKPRRSISMRSASIPTRCR